MERLIGLEPELDVELHSPRRLRSYTAAEERGANHSDIGHIVRMIQEVERVQGKRVCSER